MKTVVNDKGMAFDFYLDITKSDLLPSLCRECGFIEIFVEIYSVENNKGNIVNELLQMGFNVVFILYKHGSYDIAIKMIGDRLTELFSLLTGHDFDEITLWDAYVSWEQHLFSMSARKTFIMEEDSDLYLCYNHAESKVEMYLKPHHSVERIKKMIRKYTA